MKSISNLLLLALLIVSSCEPPEVSEEKQPLVNSINEIMSHIDSNHRVRIVEDDFHEGDSIYKIRAYYTEDNLIKIVSIMRTSHVERDDYFYFDKNEPIFSGHLMNQRDDHEAAEYKYYYQNGKVVEALYWEDTYVPGKKFPHERFNEFTPNLDSLEKTEVERLTFCLEKLAMEGVEIKHLNENLNANFSE